MVENVPGDAIARLYGVSPQIKIGTVSAKTQVSGTLTNLQTALHHATYPARGKVIIAGTNNFLFRDTVVNVQAGTVRAVGQLANGRWQASGRAAGVTVWHKFRQRYRHPKWDIQALRHHRVIQTGNYSCYWFGTREYRWHSHSLKHPTGWRSLAGSGTATGIQLGRITAATLTIAGRLNGRFNLSGGLAAITPETIQGNGSGSLQVADGTVTATNVTLRPLAGSLLPIEMENLAQLTALSRFSPQYRDVSVSMLQDRWQPSTGCYSGQGAVAFA